MQSPPKGLIPGLTRFLRDEDGVVTVDWVVMTAAILALTIWFFAVFTRGHIESAGAQINADIATAITRD